VPREKGLEGRLPLAAVPVTIGTRNGHGYREGRTTSGPAGTSKGDRPRSMQFFHIPEKAAEAQRPSERGVMACPGGPLRVEKRKKGS